MDYPDTPGNDRNIMLEVYFELFYFFPFPETCGSVTFSR